MIARRGEQALEIDALDVVHHDDVVVADLAEVLDPDDVRVVDPRGEPRLVEEVVDRALVPREVGVHDLDRDELLEPGLALGVGEVDVGHAARAEPAHDLPAADHRAGAEVARVDRERHRVDR
jgi:hypothetical protein